MAYCPARPPELSSIFSPLMCFRTRLWVAGGQRMEFNSVAITAAGFGVDAVAFERLEHTIRAKVSSILRRNKGGRFGGRCKYRRRSDTFIVRLAFIRTLGQTFGDARGETFEEAFMIRTTTGALSRRNLSQKATDSHTPQRNRTTRSIFFASCQRWQLASLSLSIAAKHVSSRTSLLPSS